MQPMLTNYTTVNPCNSITFSPAKPSEIRFINAARTAHWKWLKWITTLLYWKSV